MNREKTVNSGADDNSGADLASLTMEEAYDQLDHLLQEMESGNHTLEETFAMYSRGIRLVKCCHDKIDSVEKKLMILEENGERTEG